MLREIVNDLYNTALEAKNGMLGSVDDVYFDDKDWKIRYLVSDSVKFLPARRVLLSPTSISKVDFDRKLISTNHSKKEIEKSPIVTQGLLPSRDIEVELKDYFKWPVYWGSGYLIGAGDMRLNNAASRGIKEEVEINSNLKSCNEIIGYGIVSDNITIGYVQDLVLDDQTWDIRYLVVDTRKNSGNNETKLLALSWIQEIDWDKMKFITELKTKSIRKSPVYNSETPIKREYEKKLYEYYNKPKYWL